MFIVRKLKFIYTEKKEQLKLTSYSNFFKSDAFYEVVLREFDELDEWDMEKLRSYMIVFSSKKHK